MAAALRHLIIVTLLVLGSTACLPVGQPPAAVLADYGDAPDPTFPTLFASDGARALDITQFWLGEREEPSATLETDARVVDADEFDDGLESSINLGGTFVLRFRLVKSASATSGIVYFNVLADLNGDDQWSGEDEWVVANLEVSLAPGQSEVVEARYVYPFRDVWVRAALTDAAVSVAQFPGGWDGTGQFERGEIEDYLIGLLPEETPTPTPTEPVELPPSLLFHRDQGLVLWDLQSGQERVLHPEGYFWRGYCFSPDGTSILASKWIENSWDLVWIDVASSNFTVVAGNPNVDEVEPRCPLTTDGNLYFFVVEERDTDRLLIDSDIYRLDRIVSDEQLTWQATNLTDDADVQHYTYDVRGDGSMVAYTLFHRDAHPSPCPLFVMNGDGSLRRELTYGLGDDIFMQGCPAPMNIAWSWDGTRIHIGDSGSRWVGPPDTPIQEIYFVWVTPDGQTGSFMVENSADPLEWPRFLPPWNDRTFITTSDGGIVFSNFACESNPQSRGIFLVGEGFDPLPVAEDTDICGYEFAFSLDSRFLAFTETFPQDGIWLMDLDAGLQPQRLGDGERPVFSPW